MSMAESPFEEVDPRFRPTHTWRVSAEEDTPPPPRPPRDWRRLLRIGGPVAGMLLVLLACWWFSIPRRYHQVASFDGVDITLFPCLDGFLVQESPETFVLRDWVNGRVRWRVSVDAPAATARYFTVSPSGRYFAFLSIYASSSRLQLWDNGQPSHTNTLAAEEPGHCHVKVLDDGRIFIWPSESLRYPALLCKDGHLIASGHFPGDEISPDGSAIISQRGNQFDYGAIVVKDGQLTVANQYVGVISLDSRPWLTIDAWLFDHGFILTDTGDLYNSYGTPPIHRDWRHDTAAPGGIFTFEHQRRQAQVFSPVSRVSWSFPVPGRLFSGDATANGRFALAWYNQDQPYAFRLLNSKFPVLYGLFPRNVLGLYEKPGHLRAILPIMVDRWWNKRMPPFQWEWYPSPDGHSIAFNIAGRRISRCLLFRW